MREVAYLGEHVGPESYRAASRGCSGQRRAAAAARGSGCGDAAEPSTSTSPSWWRRLANDRVGIVGRKVAAA